MYVRVDGKQHPLLRLLTWQPHVNIHSCRTLSLFQQSGLLEGTGKGRGFVKALVTGRFPTAEIDRFVAGEPSLVDEFVGDPTLTIESMDDPGDADPAQKSDDSDVLVDAPQEASDLPITETKDVLKSLGVNVLSSADEEAVAKAVPTALLTFVM